MNPGFLYRKKTSGQSGQSAEFEYRLDLSVSSTGKGAPRHQEILEMRRGLWDYAYRLASIPLPDSSKMCSVVAAKNTP